MNTRTYKDSDGNEVSLVKLCSTEPEWAASRITSLEDQLVGARMCDACLGLPLEDSTCICGGKGTTSDELHGMRNLIFKYDDALSAIEELCLYNRRYDTSGSVLGEDVLKILEDLKSE